MLSTFLLLSVSTLAIRFVLSLRHKTKTSLLSEVSHPENYQLAEIHGEAWDQISVFQHVECGLKRNPDGPAVVCLFKQTEVLKELVEACAPRGRKLTNGISNGALPSQLWNKERSHSPPEEHCQRDSPVSLARSHDTNSFTLTYTELHRTALRLAAGLLFHGARPSSTMLMLIPNGAEYTILLWACILLRITYVNLDPACLDISGFTALKHTLQTIKPQIVVAPDALSGKAIDVAMTELELPHPIRICLLESGTALPSLTWRSLTQIAIGSRMHKDIDENAIEFAARYDKNPKRINSIMFTSGTSGMPKGCPQSASAISYALHSQSWLIDAESGAADFALMQAHNSRGIAPAQTLQTWRAGGAVVLSGQNFSVTDAINAIKKVGASFLVLTPPMVHELSGELAAREINVSSVKRIQIGGDAVTRDILVKCAEIFPRAQVCVNHGMTEGPGAFKWPFLDMCQGPDQVSKIPFLGGQLCPVGVVALGSKIRLCSTAQEHSVSGARRVVSRSQIGELHISCPSLIKHYLGGRSEESFYEDETARWFNTGDMALVDKNGLVYIVGRRKDMIRCADGLIAPAVIESCVAAFTHTQTIVIPVHHDVLSAEPFAVIESFKELSAEQIKEHVRDELGREYALGGVIELKQLGLVDIPVNATHKVIKSEVQAAVASYLRRAAEKE